MSDKSLSNKPIPEKSKANPWQIQDALIRTQLFQYSFRFEIQMVFLL